MSLKEIDDNTQLTLSISCSGELKNLMVILKKKKVLIKTAMEKFFTCIPNKISVQKNKKKKKKSKQIHCIYTRYSDTLIPYLASLKLGISPVYHLL